MKKRYYRVVFVYLLFLLKAFFSLFPYRVGFSTGGSLGKLAYFILPKEKKRMLNHLKIAFAGEKSDRELREIALKNFEHYGHTFAELVLVDKILADFKKYVTIEGTEHMDAALKAGKGIIGLVAHFGNWELMGGYLSMNGYPMNAVARKIYYEKYNDLLVSTRKRMNINTLYRDGSVRTMLGILRENKILVIAADQDVDRVDGVFVKFFGRDAYTPMAPVKFGQATGASVLSAHMVRKGIRHHITIAPAFQWVDTGNKEEDIRTNTQIWVSWQERYIRENPHLWVWNHRRWKTQSDL